MAILIAAAGVGLTIRAFGGSPRTENTPVADDTPLDIATLVRSWSVEVPDGRSLHGVSTDADRIYVPTSFGVVAYAKACVEPCGPLWTLRFDDAPPSGPLDQAEIAVGDGVVAVAHGGRLAVVRADCATGGQACDVEWYANAPADANGFYDPSISGGIAKVLSSVGEMPDHHVSAVAFRVDCRSDGGECSPSWTADLGVGAVMPRPAVGEVFYQQVGVRMTGFAADCRSDGGTCDPDFSITAPGDPTTQVGWLYGPALHQGQVVVSSGDGSVYAYPEHCGTGCVPLWTAAVAENLGWPTLAGDLVVVSHADGVSAVPLACASQGETCEPRWETRLGRHWSVEFADEHVVVAVDHFRGERAITVLPTDCAKRCEPLWTVNLENDIYGVAGDGEHVFAAVGGEILAYPLTCEAACAPVWRAEVPGETWWLFVDGYRLVAVSRMGGVMALGITITVFEASSEEPPVFFPVWSSLSQPGAIVSGSLVEHDGCLFLRSGDEEFLALWEEGYRHVNGTLLDASGRVVVRVGDELWGGGGYIGPLEHAEDLIGEPIPERCRPAGAEPYAMIYDVHPGRPE